MKKAHRMVHVDYIKHRNCKDELLTTVKIAKNTTILHTNNKHIIHRLSTEKDELLTKRDELLTKRDELLTKKG